MAGVAAELAAEDWPQWRGPRSDGTSLERGLPTAWGRGRGVCWSADIPGEGHSSPIVSGGSVFVTTAMGDGRERALVRVDAATGNVLWSKVVARSTDLESLHNENSHVSSTPATDGRAVYTSFYESGRAHLAAVAFDGRVLWSVTPLRYRSEHGYHHNPLLLGDQLVLSYDQLAEAAVIALDTRTGGVRWRTPLSNDQCSNVAPFPVRAGGQTLVITVGGDVTRALDSADGRVVWKATGPTRYCVAGTAFGAGVVFVNGGYPDRRSLALPVFGAGASRAAAWESRKGTTYVPVARVPRGPLLRGERRRPRHLLGRGHGRGEVAGAPLRPSPRVPRPRERSPLRHERRGPHHRLQGVAVRYEEEARNDLGDFVYATPALADGRIFIRTRNRLHAVGDCSARRALSVAPAVRSSSR